MKRSYSASSFLRLPPEIRVRIYSLVLGRQQVWITHTGSKLQERQGSMILMGAQSGPSNQYFHNGGTFWHFTIDSCSSTDFYNSAVHLGLLRVCRQIYTETALLPYALNTFTFKDDSVRRLFEQSARPGKRRVQKKAVGKYGLGSWMRFQERHMSRYETLMF